MRISFKEPFADIELKILQYRIKQVQREIELKKLQQDKKAQVTEARKQLEDLEKELSSL